jgi:hypothetical protein
MCLKIRDWLGHWSDAVWLCSISYMYSAALLQILSCSRAGTPVPLWVQEPLRPLQTTQSGR